jgi:uncharacterized protein Yka (UPF0111/DUF47 family)
MEKKEIIKELGESELLLPELVNSALVANDRVKYFFTLLQTARARADQPTQAFSDLQSEREAAGLDEPDLDSVVANAAKGEAGDYRIPFSAEIFAGIRSAMWDMLRPLQAKDGVSIKAYKSRLNRLLKRLPASGDAPVTAELIDAVTSGDAKAGDTPHLLVMDLHKALNAIQTELATEVIAGAPTYLLKEKDKELVRAFMSGIARTAPLKFDHPGLGATATRAGAKLVIQNDIGMTDAHVMVIATTGLTTAITYTDIHLPRVTFLRGLLAKWGVTWNDTVSKQGAKGFEKDMYHLSVGRFTAKNKEEQRSFLEHLGSRLVFLIDWNRARKALREFLPKDEGLAALRWAADNDVGHMGFLRLGGAKLIHEALEVAAPLRYREPLYEILGPDTALEYVEGVLRTAATGLLAKRSRLLINDEIRTELLRHFQCGHQGLLETCSELAMLITDVATSLRDALMSLKRGGDISMVERTARRAKRWEGQGDDLVNTVRALSKRAESAEFFAELLTASDDVLDYLEEASHLATLAAPNAAWGDAYSGLVKMADIVLSASQEFLKALYAAQYVQKGYTREDIEGFLAPLDRVLNLEREEDEAYRTTERAIVRGSTDFKQFWALLELARAVEKSTNSLMKAVYILRDYVLKNANG